MAFFKSKKRREETLDMPMPSPEMQAPQPQASPVEQVLMMKQQGYTNFS
ncbi:hypothetical protein HYX05_00090 [Candidatus Woesearchaeota archaeon]|nr:hypothetical protein [Candidatus Woesearchaeota archaeon]